MSDDHWHRPLTHVRAGDLSGDTGQTSGMARWEAISGKSAGAEKLWMGQTHVAAGAKSGNHHHGEAETAIYVVSGTPAFVFADGDEEIRLQTKPGDYTSFPRTSRTARRTRAPTRPSWSSRAAARRPSWSTCRACGPRRRRALTCKSGITGKSYVVKPT